MPPHKIPLQSHAPSPQNSPVKHLFPHPPQLFVSVCSFTHAPPHTVSVLPPSPVGQVQVPLWQLAPVAHAVPQTPQLFVSTCSSTQTPLQTFSVRSSIGPFGQAHLPLWHV